MSTNFGSSSGGIPSRGGPLGSSSRRSMMWMFQFVFHPIPEGCGSAGSRKIGSPAGVVVTSSGRNGSTASAPASSGSVGAGAAPSPCDCSAAVSVAFSSPEPPPLHAAAINPPAASIPPINHNLRLGNTHISGTTQRTGALVHSYAARPDSDVWDCGKHGPVSESAAPPAAARRLDPPEVRHRSR